MPTPISHADLTRLLDAGAQLVEVLPEPEYREEHLPGAINIPLKTRAVQAGTRLVGSCLRASPSSRRRWVALDRGPRCRRRRGFGEVFDYVAGKADWLARGLPSEGENASRRCAVDAMASEVVTCALDDRADDVAARLAASRDRVAFVVSARGVVLGRVEETSLSADGSIDAVMDPGPSTIRADVPLERLVERMTSRGIDHLPVTTPDGELLGIVRREDLDR